jgi:8-oxo-dGTP pyrophosphatase MutT (NUDIX family)
MELEEEIGIKINPDKLFLIKTGKWEPSKHFFESYVYPFNDQLDTLKFNDGEIVKADWFSFDEYNLDKQHNPDKWCNGCSPENQQIINDWLKKSRPTYLNSNF